LIFGGIFDYDAKSERLRTVNASLEDPSVWNEPKKAQELSKEKKSLEDVVIVLSKLEQEIADNLELFEMVKSEDDDNALVDIELETANLNQSIEKLEFRRMFNNPADPCNAFLDIQAGAGGTEACDWASMLLRQYLRYAERKNFKATLEDESAKLGKDWREVAQQSSREKDFYDELGLPLPGTQTTLQNSFEETKNAELK